MLKYNYRIGFRKRFLFTHIRYWKKCEIKCVSTFSLGFVLQFVKIKEHRWTVWMRLHESFLRFSLDCSQTVDDFLAQNLRINWIVVLLQHQTPCTTIAEHRRVSHTRLSFAYVDAGQFAVARTCGSAESPQSDADVAHRPDGLRKSSQIVDRWQYHRRFRWKRREPHESERPDAGAGAHQRRYWTQRDAARWVWTFISL